MDTMLTIAYRDNTPDEAVDCWNATVKDGVLHIQFRSVSAKADRHIPLDRIREYTTRSF